MPLDSLIGRLLLPWLRFTLRPEGVGAQLADAAAPVCYVLERQSTTDLVVLQRACAQARLPRPGKRLPQGGRSIFEIGRAHV